MKGNVVVQIKWADPRRRGMRTLVVNDTTISATFRRLSRSLTGDADERAHVPGGDAVIVHVDKVPEPDPEPDVVGQVSTIDAVPADSFGAANTLIQVHVGERRVLVKVSGQESLPVGSAVRLANLPCWGKLFEATLTRTAPGSPLITIVQPLM